MPPGVKERCPRNERAPIPIHFNPLEIGAILVNPFSNEALDKDEGVFLPKQGVIIPLDAER
jgi:hypothetical protein